MKFKIIHVIKTIQYYVKYRRKLKFKGFLKIDCRSKINIREGKMCVGNNLTVKSNSYIAVVNNGEFAIGNNVYINRNCTMICQESIVVGDSCSFGPNVVIYDHDHCFGANGIENGFNTSPVFIGDNCWIGAGTIILRGTSIGEGCVIGAGTVVKGEIPSHSLVTQENRKKLSIVPLV